MGGIDRLRAVLSTRAPRELRAEAFPPALLAAQGELSRAAVLVPLFEREGEVHVLLTRRRADLRQHAGQVSFPGGRMENGEESLAAALREAWEEIGLEPRRVEVLGRLDETLVGTTWFRLTPWVGLVPYPYPFVANPGEVEAILSCSLIDLARPGVHRTEEREAYGGRHLIHFYEIPPLTIWGATARILSELVTLWSAR
ncbi:MAG TPA: CoA pyrophosphatase [Anaeromyxobacteraceae bacterium]|nr:CoA pyrophosphatase [Anaeromyxobacteraceae bacterium]